MSPPTTAIATTFQPVHDGVEGLRGHDGLTIARFVGGWDNELHRAL